MKAYKTEFLELALELEVLKFGQFTLKSGRVSPYFFNAGGFNTGYAAAKIGRIYAAAVASIDIKFDMLFGPAYKGITLAAATAIALAEKGHNVPFCFNRKEAKDHGEGGQIVGAPLRGRVVIVDDVITDGAAKREAIELIRAHGAEPAAVLIALDRMERGQGEASAVQELQARFGVPVVAIATLVDLIAFIGAREDLKAQAPRVAAYRAEYGVSAG
jgi:orotate phosphoribosyltransferase